MLYFYCASHLSSWWTEWEGVSSFRAEKPTFHDGLSYPLTCSRPITWNYWVRHPIGSATTMKPSRKDIVVLAVLICATIAPHQSIAVQVEWGTPYKTSGGNTALSLQIWNNNSGTTYTSAQVNSLTQLFTLYGITDPNGTTDGKRNVDLTVNDGAGYVNQGWNASLNDQGQININQNQSNPFADDFNFGDIFAITIGFNNNYLIGLGKDPNNIALTENTWGLTDTAYWGDDYFQDQPTYIPVPEPSTGALALAGIVALFKRHRRSR